jgi:hypothetical protein
MAAGGRLQAARKSLQPEACSLPLFPKEKIQ